MMKIPENLFNYNWPSLPHVISSNLIDIIFNFEFSSNLYPVKIFSDTIAQNWRKTL